MFEKGVFTAKLYKKALKKKKIEEEFLVKCFFSRMPFGRPKHDQIHWCIYFLCELCLSSL